MKLYYSPASPYVRKVLVCAEECGLKGDLKLIPTSVSPTAPNREYARVTPLMKLPALECQDGSVLFDSVVICEFLNDLAGADMFPSISDDRWSALRFHALGDGMLEAALLARYELAARPSELRWQAWLEGQLNKVDTSLKFLEEHVEELGGRLNIGTIGVGCALGYLDFRFPERRWREACPRLASWFSILCERPSFASSRPSA